MSGFRTRALAAGARSLPLAALVLLVTTVFFSVALEILSAALCWAAVLVGAVSRDGRLARPRPPVGLVVALMVFLLVSALSAALGVVPARGLRTVARELLSAGGALAAASLVAPRHARTVLAVFLAAATVAGLWSIQQFVFEFDWQLSVSHRAHGFWHWTAFISYANVLAIAFAAALGLVTLGKGRERGASLVVIGAALIGMVLSYTRSTWLVSAWLVGVVALWRRAVLVLLVLVFAGAALLWLPGSDESRQLAARARSAFDPAAQSNQDRLARYRMGMAIVRDHPALGLGPGGVIAEHERYAVPGVQGVWHLHNAFLQIAAERGLIGLAAWLAVLVGALRRAVRAARGSDGEPGALAGAVALAILAFLMLGAFNYPWEDWRVRALVLLFVGAAWSPAVTGPREAGTPTTVTRS